ncbi:MAG: ABC transporter substrate-binding protein [Actinomycetota bacterium]|nr:ABC transporter substrate-binding protein [Actinomycetota bacterium]
MGLKRLLVVAATLALIGAGCSSSNKKPTGSPTTTGGQAPTATAYTIGLLTDLTGLASSAESSTPNGVKAGVGLANASGYNIKYIVADAQSSPGGALSAAQKLVEQDHVFAVIAVSGLTFAAASYLTSHDIPVIGANTDGTEWITAPNMFSVFGTGDYHKVSTTAGAIFKLLGATNIASLGYSIVPSAKLSAEGSAASVEAAGLKVGYLNPNFPFGGTNVGPTVIAMKNAKVDGFTGSVEENTSFAIAEGMRQAGAPLKVALFSVGYGGDLYSAGPGAEQAAQNGYFSVSYEPVEMHTAATERLQKALATYAGITQDPTLNEYIGYASVNAFTKGLQAAGPNPTQATFIKAMLSIRSYNADGLFGSHSVGFALDQRGIVGGADNCIWLARFAGTTFHLVQGAEPICGTNIPGKTVS